MSAKKTYEDRYAGSVEIYDNFVLKLYDDKSKKYGIFEREKFWLKELSEFERTPNIIEVGDDFIKMEFVGVRIDKNNIPSNWKIQMEYILNSLKKHQCSHNDIKPEDILVKDSLIYLIDFGWSTKIGDAIPNHWPDIGDEFKFSKHNFNDEYSFIESIKNIMT